MLAMSGSGSVRRRASRRVDRAAGDGARRQRGNGLTTALPVTFLGMLLVHGLRAEAAETSAHGSFGERTVEPQTPHPLDAHADSGVAGFGLAPAAGDAGAMAAGSVLTAGAFIDTSALARLSGAAHFADQPAQAIAYPAGFTPSAHAMLTPVVGGDEPGITLAGPTEIVLPATDTSTGTGTGGENIPSGTDGHSGADGGTLVGTSGDDTLIGGPADDVIQGLGGNDQIDGGEGNDRLEGGDGNDTIFGGPGNDVLIGGPGADRTDGGPGNDTHVVDNIQDVAIEHNEGADGGGIDTLVVTDDWSKSLASTWPHDAPLGQATFVLGEHGAGDFPAGLDAYRTQVNPYIENITLEGSAPHDVIGSAGDNVITGNEGVNHLHGMAGDDHLLGMGGDDALYGDDGNDWLTGGDGADQLYGGAGDDHFVLGLYEKPDMIFDHEGVNTLHLDGIDPSKLTASLNQGELTLAYNGKTVATIEDYAPNHWAGIDLGHGVQPLDDLLSIATTKAAAVPPDLLTGFFTTSEVPAKTATAEGTAAATVADDPWGALPESAHAKSGHGLAEHAAADPWGSSVVASLPPLDNSSLGHGFADDPFESQSHRAEHHRITA